MNSAWTADSASEWRRLPLSILLLLVELLISSGCSPSSKTMPAEAPSKAARWNWEVFPCTNRLRLSLLPAQVQALAYAAVVCPAATTVRFYVATSETNLPKGTLWAECEPEMLAIESNSLHQAELQFDLQKRLASEFEAPRFKVQTTKQLWEAERQLALFSLAATNAAAAQAYPSPFVGLTAANAETRALLQLEVDLLRAATARALDTNFTMLGKDFVNQAINLEKRRLDFMRQREASRLVMPFAGRLSIALPVTANFRDHRVNAGQDIALMRDESTIHLRIVISRPDWLIIQPDKMEVLVKVTGHENIGGRFAFKRTERVMNRDDIAYYFTLPPGRNEDAAKLLGSEVGCDLIYCLDASAYIVPKLTALLANPGLFKSIPFAEAVSTLWPGASLLAEGATEVAILRGRNSGSSTTPGPDTGTNGNPLAVK